MSDADALLVATAAAREAGALARDAFRSPLEIASKGEQDIVTQVDHAAEALICDLVQAAFPADAILAEERGQQDGTSGYCWIIDPLDGTHNYAAQLPFWCISIARYDERAQHPEVGVIYDPLHDELFAAVRGEGATLNGAAMHVSAVPDLRQGVLACDIGYNRAISRRMMRTAQEVQPRSRRLRIMGSAVLALAYVAAGRIDCFVHLHLQPWDLAAAWLLLKEAGGTITTWEGQDITLEDFGVVAANATLHAQVLRLLAEIGR
jgi:myo-inositol-1(or 4)-monophosphatase